MKSKKVLPADEEKETKGVEVRATISPSPSEYETRTKRQDETAASRGKGVTAEFAVSIANRCALTTITHIPKRLMLG